MQYVRVTKDDGKLQLVSKAAPAAASRCFESDVSDYLQHITVFTYKSETWGLAATAFADRHGTVWTWGFTGDVWAHISTPQLTRIFTSTSVKDLGAGLLFKIWHPVAISPFSTFSGLLEDFQVEDSHLLNHGKHRLSSECHLFKGTDPAWPCLDWDLMSPRPRVLW